MLLKGFTGFDDVIIVFVMTQHQNILFKKLNKNNLTSKRSYFYHLPNSLTPIQIGCENIPVDIGLNNWFWVDDAIILATSGLYIFLNDVIFK